MASGTRAITSKFEKREVLKQLRDAESAIERTLKTYEKKLQEWREEAPRKLAQKIESYGDGKDQYYFGSRDFDFSPPTLGNACSDYRIQALNKHILRITAMDGDVISLRTDDPLWDFVNLAACL